MPLLTDLRYRLRALFRRDVMDRELDDEFRFHLDREIEKHVAAGVPPDEARRRAHASFGTVTGAREATRDARGLVVLEQLASDLRYAVRGLAARPVFTTGVVLTLALGIGANATIFGVVDRLLFRPPTGMPDQDRVHRLYTHYTSGNGERASDRNHGFATYRDLLEATRTIEKIAAFQTRRLAVGEGAVTRELPVTLASASYFDLFDARPLLGRFFDANEDRIPAGQPVAVLGYGFWQAHFGGRPDVIGTPIRIGRMPYTVIGVAPAGFVGTSDQGVPAAYIPITNYAYSMRGPSYPSTYFWTWLELLVRRRADASLAEAQTELTAAFTRSWRRVAETTPSIGSVETARPEITIWPVQLGRGPHAGRESTVARWLAGVAFIVLLIACANVANLLLSRAVSRRREIAVRIALGVSRARLARQLLTESLVLAIAGGLAGLAVAQLGSAAVRTLFFTSEQPVTVVTDGRTLLFATAATLVVALLTGLAPVLHASRGDVAAAVKAGAREGTHQRSGLRTSLLVVQATFSVVLLVGAGLFVRSLQNVKGFRLGYDADRIVFANVNLRGEQLTASAARALVDRTLVAIRSVPGVSHVTVVAAVPFLSNEMRLLTVPGVDSISRRGRFLLQSGTADYFPTMGTRILRGRAFDARDAEGSPRVVVVSEGMARAIWPNEDAIGKCIRISEPTAPCTTVIGIAEEMRARTLTDAREFAYYMPAWQVDGDLDPYVMARVTGDPAALANDIRLRMQQEMPGAAYASAVPLDALVDPARLAWRFGATMFVAFGGLALVVAAIGLYALIAYDVAQRTQELGVRIALGASAPAVVRLVVGGGLRLVVVGVVFGGTLALWGSRFMEGLMFRQSPRDPIVFGVVAIVLILVALVASAGPALRAARVDPNIALRSD